MLAGDVADVALEASRCHSVRQPQDCVALAALPVIVAVADRLQGEAGCRDEAADRGARVLAHMADVSDAAQLAKRGQRTGDAAAENEAGDARQRVDVRRRQQEEATVRQDAADFRQDERRPDAQVFEGIAQQRPTAMLIGALFHCRHRPRGLGASSAE